MPKLEQIRDLAVNHDLNVTYTILPNKGEYIEISFRDSDQNYHSGKITFDSYGAFYSLILSTADLNAIDRFVAFFAGYKALINN